MKGLIKVGYLCNQRCVFCHNRGSQPQRGSASSIETKITRAAELGCRTVVLSGGEPTIRPELVRWASHAAALGLSFGLVTNGRMLAYAGLTERLFELKLSYLHLALHGGTASLHNSLTGDAGFTQSLEALRLLSGRGLDLTVNCVVTTANVERLGALVNLLQPWPDVRLKFSLVEPKGAALEQFSALVPSVELAADRVAKAIHQGLTVDSERRFAHEHFPLCLLGDLAGLASGLESDGFAWMSEAHDSDLFPVDHLNRVHPAPCRPCVLQTACPGLFREVHARRGAEGLHPVTGPAEPLEPPCQQQSLPAEGAGHGRG